MVGDFLGWDKQVIIRKMQTQQGEGALLKLPFRGTWGAVWSPGLFLTFD